MALAGNYHVVSSGLTNAPIRYFCPHQASRLRASLELGMGTERPIPIHEAIAYFVYLTQIGALTLRFATPEAIRANFFRARPAASENFLLEGARDVIGMPVTIRETIAFSGGSSPSTASHVYTPPAEIQRHFSDFARTINGISGDVNAAGTAAFTHLYALLLHPLIDGNGRWARWLAIVSANRLGSSFSALPAMCFFYRNERAIIESMRLADIASIQVLIDKSIRTENYGVRQDSVSVSAIKLATERLSEWLSECDQMCIMANGLLSPSIDACWISSFLRCSKKKAEIILAIVSEASKVDAEKGGEGRILPILKNEMNNHFLDEKDF